MRPVRRRDKASQARAQSERRATEQLAQTDVLKRAVIEQRPVRRALGPLGDAGRRTRQKADADKAVVELLLDDVVSERGERLGDCLLICSRTRGSSLVGTAAEGRA